MTCCSSRPQIGHGNVHGPLDVDRLELAGLADVQQQEGLPAAHAVVEVPHGHLRDRLNRQVGPGPGVHAVFEVPDDAVQPDAPQPHGRLAGLGPVASHQEDCRIRRQHDPAWRPGAVAKRRSR